MTPRGAILPGIICGVSRVAVSASALALLLVAGCKRGPAAPRAPSVDVAATMQAVVNDFRGVVALLADEPAPEDRAAFVARLLYQDSEERLAALRETAVADESARSTFLDKLESDAGLRDGDKLAFRDVLSDLPASTRVAQDRAVLDAIQARYDAEMKKLFGQLPTRGMVDRREAWEDYLAFVRAQISRDDLIAAHAAELDALAAGARGIGGGWRDDKDQVTGHRFPDKSVLLTFDDGPSSRFTPAILEILKRHGLRAVFFQVGRNIGKAEAETRNILAAGHALANHSFTHAFLPKLDAGALDHQLVDTNAALEAAVKLKPLLFRPPYGARNDRILAASSALGMKTILWNIDSQDWADPVPQSIASRVVAQVERQKHGIILFHDIHERTTQALPLVIDELQKRGYRFLSWDGRDFTAPRGGGAAETAPVVADVSTTKLYRDSWAVIIGINAYKSWPRLSYAVNDARAVRDTLEKKYGFAPDHVTTLLDGDATREKILAALGDSLADTRKVSHDDRVFVFFAGHGVTRKLPNGKAQGYIVPVDAAAQNYQSQAISMTNFQDASDAIAAKHVFFVMDACYGGLALTRGGGGAATGDRRQYLMEVTRRSAREVLTAGGGDEQVADNGPGGHSIFTWTLLQGLEGKADLDGDGAITATELAAYVGPSVSSLSRQTPAFGHLAGSEGGEFVFVLKPEDEFLSEESRQLDSEAIKLNGQLERIRKQIDEKRARNEKLKSEIAAATVALASGGKKDGGAAVAPIAPIAAATEPADTVRGEVQRGMSLYREKRYEEAAKAFEHVLAMRPGHVMATNNLGFTYFKLGRYEDAVTWYRKAIELDPKRAIAYANLGDALAQLGRADEAKRAYQTFLEMSPKAPAAPSVQQKLAAMP
jgi:peptidoglycan/xylan/chitin deacetylase (PgdA/CDA1 family)/tetratricopeptide (TPR) repeat protein